jgi:lipopolysaccharide export system permease protein
MPLVGVILTMVGLVWLSQIVKLIYLIDRGVSFKEFMFLVTLVLPSLIFTILPFAMIIGVLIGYNHLSYDRELIALSNSGLSSFSLVRPVLNVAVFVTIIGYFISLYLLPMSYSVLKSNLQHFRENYASNLVQERVFTRISKNVTLYVDEKKSGGLLKGVILFDNRSEGHNAILFAKSGRIRFYAGVPLFELNNGTRQEVDQFGKMTKMHFGILSVALGSDRCNADIIAESVDENELKRKCNSIIDPASRDLNEHFIGELFRPNYKLSNERMIKLKSEGHQRIIWPLYSLALTSLALGIFMQKPYSRRGNGAILLKAGLAVAVVIGLHFAARNASSKLEIMNVLSYVNIAICFGMSYLLLSEQSRFGRRIGKLFS